MTKAEQAIRNALLKVNAIDPAIRRRVYESAWNAHERVLINDRSLTKTDLATRRNQLTQIISLIEKECLQIHGNNQPSQQDLASYGPEEEIAIGEDNDPFFHAPRKAHDTAPSKHKKKIIIISLSVCFCFLFLIFIVWSFYNSVSVKSNVAVQHVSPTIESIVQQTLPVKQPDDGWLQIFSPADISTLSVRGAASIQLRNDLGEQYVYIFANSPQDAAIVDIGEGILRNLRGKKAVINIVAKSNGAKKTQLSLTCDFGNSNSCGRHRFEVPVNRDNLVFEVTVPTNITGAGKLYLTTDLLGEGNAMNIYSISIKEVD